MNPIITIGTSTWLKDAFLAGGAVSFFLLLCTLYALVKVYRDKCRDAKQYGDLLENRHTEIIGIAQSSAEVMTAVKSSLDCMQKSLDNIERK